MEREVVKQEVLLVPGVPALSPLEEQQEQVVVLSPLEEQQEQVVVRNLLGQVAVAAVEVPRAVEAVVERNLLQGEEVAAVEAPREAEVPRAVGAAVQQTRRRIKRQRR